MAGFTLGGPDGATLGENTGGTLGVAPSHWWIDNQPIPISTDEESTHRTLTLSWRASTTVLVDRIRPAKTNEDQINTLTTDSGGFTSIDRAGGENTFELTPPAGREPLRQPGTYHVTRYEEDLVSQEVEEWDVEIDFVRARNRSDSPSIMESRESGEWSIDTRHGTVATDRVDAEFLGTGSDGVERYELVLRLRFRQAHVLEAALSRLDGVRVRAVADGSNVIVDDSQDGANTVGVVSPTGRVVGSGEYVATGFESVRLNDAWQEVSLELAVTG